MKQKEEREIEEVTQPTTGNEHVIPRPRKKVTNNYLLITIAVLVGVLGVMGVSAISGAFIGILTIIIWVLIYKLGFKDEK